MVTHFYGNRFITDFKEKANLFNFIFSKQWSQIPNSFLLMSIILLRKAYLQLHLQLEILEKPFRILIQSVDKCPHAKSMW